jgi:hypothetical protein
MDQSYRIKPWGEIELKGKRKQKTCLVYPNE